MKYGPEADGLSWSAVTEDNPEDAIIVIFLGVFEELPVEAKQKVMEGALGGLDSFFANKQPDADVAPKKGQK